MPGLFIDAIDAGKQAMVVKRPVDRAQMLSQADCSCEEHHSKIRTEKC